MTAENLKYKGITIFRDQFLAIASWLADQLVNNVNDDTEAIEILEELSLEN